MQGLSGAHPIQVMANAYMTARAIYVMAKLGVADLLKGGPRSAAELAEATNAQPVVLHRLLRALAAEGVFHEDVDGRFSLTALGQPLRSDVDESLRAYILMHHETFFSSWVEVMHTVRTGEPAFNKVFGMTRWEFLESNPEAAETFHTAMMQLRRFQDPSLAETYDFSRARLVIDVGGGNGSLLSRILMRYQNLSGILFERESGVAAAKAGTGGALPRCEFVVGDFFKEVTPGADLYILKRVLHDWKDEQAVSILRNCRRAMTDGGRVLIIESIIGPANERSRAIVQDLVMLLGLEGMERTVSQYAELLVRADLRLEQVLPTPSDLSVLVAVAA